MVQVNQSVIHPYLNSKFNEAYYETPIKRLDNSKISEEKVSFSLSYCLELKANETQN